MGNAILRLRYGFWVKIIAQIKSTLINGESPGMDNAQEENLLTLIFNKINSII
jgi:hypothetical protein